MKMLVETFEVTEIVPEGTDPSECDNETRELVKKLGLEGQNRFVGIREDADEYDAPGPMIPYARMTDEEVNVYRCLFDQRTKLEKYDSGLIPLRVLQVMAYVKSEQSELFECVEIWCPKDRKFEDPLLVGINKYSEYNTPSQENFLLARWGTSLETFSKLREKAIFRLREERKAAIEKGIAEGEILLKGVNNFPTRKLLDIVSQPSFNGGW